MERKSDAVIEAPPIVSLVRGITQRALLEKPSAGQLPLSVFTVKLEWGAWDGAPISPTT
jgi:hypothetical protein